ncbi:uncharacterized protein EV420DRAFT_1472689 [Desarmillaria tabescens]|uniref:Uncharacterized protein n=1 Tax=Armillaria tabescens TaxID=1929756 RepID=A0AA39NPI6_ARMTA|nr:uncharacterized protein EV420DRAFT_1472689 [Desarmillaria tabescens]KAK0469462.1 hypothetical protein EV420DRAFT_1472689 [Desarmillaria tabescens]
MQQFACNLYDLDGERVLTHVVSSLHIVRPIQDNEFTFRDAYINKNSVVIFGRMEPNTSVALHLLRPDYKAHGWFRLTWPMECGFGAARILYDTQIQVLKEFVARDAKDTQKTLSWIAGETEKDVLMYIDLERVNVYAPWEEASGIGLLPSDSVNMQDKLLRQATHHPVQITAMLQHIPDFLSGIEAFIVKANRVDIIPVA